MTTRDSQVLFQRRVWQRRILAVRPLLIGLGALAAVAAAGWVVMFSSWLAVDKVSVSGLETVPEKQVLRAADVPIGTPLMRVDLGAIEQRVAAVPAVAKVTVHRSWPHSITIGITERQPVASIHTDSGWWAIDGQGVLFGHSDAASAGLPVIVLGPRADDDARQEVAAVVAALPAGVLVDVRRITARTMDSIQLDLTGGTTVVWGSSAESARKVQVLAALLKDVKASVYDVSVPEQPTTSQ